MHIVARSLEELTPIQLYEYLQLRSEVFVVEQECIYLDPDGKDDKAIHVLGYSEEGELVACTRIFGPGDYMEWPSIGRVAVKASHRGRDLGKEIVRASISELHERYGARTIALSAQTYLVKFYRELGFRETGGEYLEDGIPHISMIREEPESIR